MVQGRVIKPKNQRAKRYLESREPKVFENDKTTMFIKGGQTSDTVSRVLQEFAILKKPLSTSFHRKNIMRPFDDQNSIEFFSQKTDSSLFMFGSHSKKRPHNLVIGRLHDYHVLDMFEFGIENFKSMKEFQINIGFERCFGRESRPMTPMLRPIVKQKAAKVTAGIKPSLVFCGDKFESDVLFGRIKNILIDVFRGPSVKQIRLSGVEHVYQFVVQNETIYLRSYKILLKKSGSRTPRIELEEIGPSVDLKLRRSKVASDDLYKQANKQPKVAKPKKTKNISMDPFGRKLGQIHMGTPDYDKLQTRKMKGLKAPPGKKSKTDESAENEEEEEMEQEQEVEQESDVEEAVINVKKSRKRKH